MNDKLMSCESRIAIRRRTDKYMSHLYVGGGFPRASQCITTFFSSESKGKIKSSGSWIKTGPNSSLSDKKKNGGDKDDCNYHNMTPLSFNIQLLFLLFLSLVSASAYFLPHCNIGNKRKARCTKCGIINKKMACNSNYNDILQHILSDDDIIVIYCITDCCSTLGRHSSNPQSQRKPGGRCTSEGEITS